MEREALKLALEALEGMQNAIYNIEGEHVIGLSYAIEQADVTEQAITVIRKALAQPAQEPVAGEHITDGSPCWCEPETIYTDPETFVSVIVHKEPQ